MMRIRQERMKHLGKGTQLAAQSHPEIVALLEELTTRLTKTGVSFLGKKLTTGMLMNGLILLLSDQEPDIQLRRGILAVSRLERWSLELPEPASIPLDEAAPNLEGPAEPRGRPDVQSMSDDPPAPKKRRRPKRR